MFDFNKNKGFVIALLGALVLSVVFLVLWRMEAGACSESILNHQDIADNYERLVTKHNGEPCKKLVDLYNAKLEGIKKGKEEMKLAVVPKELPKYTPASFKGALKDASDYFYDLTSEKGIQIDKNLGFAKYIAGNELPTKSEIPTFTRQFVTIKDVLNTLIANGVYDVTVIDRSPGGEETEEEDWDDEEVSFDDEPAGREEKSKKVESKKELYNAIPVLFQFKTSPAQLTKIIAGIRNANQFYRIKNIEAKAAVQAEGETTDPSDINEIISVSFIVENIKF